MKNKKHYNSFHPELGFFLHIKDVLSWFEGDESYFTTVSSSHDEFLSSGRQERYPQMAKLEPKAHEKLLKESLVCWHCNQEMKNMPTLKPHLQEEWDSFAKKEKARLERTKELEKGVKKT